MFTKQEFEDEVVKGLKSDYVITMEWLYTTYQLRHELEKQNRQDYKRELRKTIDTHKQHTYESKMLRKELHKHFD